MPIVDDARPCTGEQRDVNRKPACLEEDPELFFPVGDRGAALDQIAEAKAVCSICPVMQECRDRALATREEFGIWGGLTERQRRAIHRRELTLARAMRRAA
jgi:WhiB family redox-sensing transcriptional regulator